jgi:hypothetical protein
MLLARGRLARERKVEEYGKRQARQETQYGHSVSERAADADSPGNRTPVSGRTGRERQNGDHADPA